MQGLYLLYCVVVTIICLGHSQSNPCIGKPDNPDKPNEVKCFSKTYCKNEVEITEDCPDGEVMERDSYSCKNQSEAQTACGTTPDCTGKATGMYGDETPNCQTFYWCIGGQYHPNSRQYCAAQLVWDSRVTRCQHAHLVPSPCGTAT